MQRFIWFISAFISFVSLANQPFEIPRSSVVELTEPSTQRVYPLFIKLPKSYQSSPKKHYPVIYLTDALYTFQIASGATRFPMNSGAMKEVILVGVSYAKGSKGASSRVRDFTPSKATSWRLTTGNAKEHAAFFRNQIFSYMASHYRVKTDDRTYVGNSLGGLFGAYMLFEHPEMFSSYIIGSPSVWFDSNKLLSLKVNQPTSPKKVYIAVGSLEQPSFGLQNDMVAGAKQLVDKINTDAGNNIKVAFNIIDGASHATAFPTTLIQGLAWIYGIDSNK